VRWALFAVAALCLAAAGCGGGGKHVPTRAEAQRCRLSGPQKRAVAATLRDIRGLHRLEAPLTRWSENGTPAMQTLTGKVLDDIGRVGLPLDTRARLLHLGKAASGLCGSCFGAFEAEEPVVAARLGRNACTGR
jgi:hypothetical protein